jgi:hypothetical protein
LAPEAVKVALELTQTPVELGAMVITGSELVFTDTVKLFLHPSVLVPVTTYVVLVAGATLREAVVAPLFHE